MNPATVCEHCAATGTVDLTRAGVSEPLVLFVLCVRCVEPWIDTTREET